MKKFGSVFVLFCMLFAFAACSSDGDDGSGNGGGSDVIDNGDGTVTLKIEEEKAGFISTTGKLSTHGSYPGYKGKFVDYLGADSNIIYSVNAAEAQKVKIHLRYAYWGTRTDLRGAYVEVNGNLYTDIIYCNWTSKNGKDDNTAGGKTHAIWEDSNSVEVSLLAGENQLRIVPVPAGTSMPKGVYPSSVTISDISGNANYLKASGSLPNIDSLSVRGKGISAGTGSVSYYKLVYSSENTEYGTVTCKTESGTSVVKNTQVKLTATPNEGYKFDCWTGSHTSNESEITVTVSQDMTISARFVPKSYANDGLEGYASITDDDGTSYTITGGAGGEEITISTLDDLDANKSILSGNEPCVVTFTERITTSDNKSIILNIGSNKTIYGKAGANAGLKNIEMRVEGSNVIIRNMVFGEVIAYDGQPYSGSGNDALSLNGASHVWVDHCELKSNIKPVLNDGTVLQNPGDEDFEKDFYDGLLDIKNGATWITISNCYFHDHYKAVLCGSGDENPDTSPAGISDRDMRVTFAGNYFKNINARMPLFRWGKGHIYNSYFDAGEFSSDASCINVRAESELYIESNTFVGMKSGYAIGFYYDTNASRTGKWVSSNNTGASNKNDTVDRPKYSYTPSRPAEAPSDVGAVLSADKLQ